mgnify:CR=1 FL=1
MYLNGVNVKDPGSAGYKKMTRRFSGRGEGRFWEIDFLRGLCVILMVFDHLMYCLWDIMPIINDTLGTTLFAECEELGRAYWSWNVRLYARGIVITLFFLLCGVSCTLTRGNFRRAVPLGLVALGITAVTSLLSEFTGSNMTVLFGVIHMLACAVFLYAFLDNAAVAAGDCLGEGRVGRGVKSALRLLPGLVGAGLLLWYFSLSGLASFTFEGGYGHVVSNFTGAAGVEENKFLAVFLYIRPDASNGNFNFERYSGDYFPLLPFAATVLLGGLIGRIVYHTRAKYAFAPLDGAWNSGVCFLGRHTAVIYIAHMIVIPVLLAAAAFVSKAFL